MNENGQLLTKFCSKNNLCITNNLLLGKHHK